MLNSEKLKIFDNNRPEFKPYGFTVEKWIPRLMPRPDRHNEIEVNLLTGGTITYLINDKKKLFRLNESLFFGPFSFVYNVLKIIKDQYI